jgi:hypothetical protein
MQDLNNLIPAQSNIPLTAALGFNDMAQIVAIGHFQNEGADDHPRCMLSNYVGGIGGGGRPRHLAKSKP